MSLHFFSTFLEICLCFEEVELRVCVCVEVGNEYFAHWCYRSVAVSPFLKAVNWF